MKTAAARLLLASLASISLSARASAELIYGIAEQGGARFLITWDSASPENLQSAVVMTPNIPILAIDARPSTSDLYALIANGNEYHVSLVSPSGAFTGSPGPPTGVPVNGFSHGFDFNPTIDRIRVVSDVNKNYVFNPITGALQLAATDVFYPAGDPNAGTDPNIAGSAYSNNFPTALTSQLYGIDTGLDILVTQANNTGVLGTVGSLGVNVSALAGFDISGVTGLAYATMTPAGSSQSVFYTINLATGLATPVGPIGGGIVITAMTAAPVPEPTGIGILLVGLLTAVAVRHRD